MSHPKPVALDHNFPEPYLRPVLDLLPEFEFHWIKDLPPDRSLNLLEDHDLIYELAKRGFAVMVTNNHKMLDDLRVLVAIEQVRFTVVAIERAGDDPVFATGVLLRDLVDVVRINHPKGLYVRVRPARVKLQRSRERLKKLGRDPDQAIRDEGRSWNERRPLPADDPRRVS